MLNLNLHIVYSLICFTNSYALILLISLIECMIRMDFIELINGDVLVMLYVEYGSKEAHSYRFMLEEV